MVIHDLFENAKVMSLDALKASAREWQYTIFTLCIVCAVSALGWFIADHHGTPFINLLRDPNVIGDQPWYGSGLEFAGFIFLGMGVGSTLLGASLCRGQARFVLAVVGLFTLALLLDDMFMLHENAWQIGLTEKRVYAAYAIVVLYITVFNLRFLSKTPLFLLGSSFIFMGFALLVDTFENFFPPIIGLEDLSELAGFIFWTSYWSAVAYRSIHRHFRSLAM